MCEPAKCLFEGHSFSLSLLSLSLLFLPSLLLLIPFPISSQHSSKQNQLNSEMLKMDDAFALYGSEASIVMSLRT